MKTLLLISVFTSCFSAYYGTNTHKAPDSSVVLELEGKVLNCPEKSKDPCKVYLLLSNKIIDSADLSGKHKRFSFLLNKNRFYTVKMSMPGHLDKLICIDTKNSSLPIEADLHKFSFETSLLPNDPALHISSELTDLPIAIIYYVQKFSRFDYNKEYTNNRKRDLQLAATNSR